jgi:ribosome-associated protein
MNSADDKQLRISSRLTLPIQEIEIRAIRAEGPGGQHVNKTSSAIHLRFDIRASSLPEFYKLRLLAMRDQRITNEGIIILKANRHRSQDRNRIEALERLVELIRKAGESEKRRIATAPTRGARKRRMDAKNRRGNLKKLRGKVNQRDI